MPKLALLIPDCLGDVAELAVAFVVKQVVAFERGDVDVVAAVVIVIGDGHAHAVHLDVEAAARGDVGERAVVVVAIERRERLAAARRPVLAVDEQDVGPAVAIGIEERAARAQRFRQVFLAGAPAVVREVDAGRCGDVGELDVARRRRDDAAAATTAASDVKQQTSPSLAAPPRYDSSDSPGRSCRIGRSRRLQASRFRDRESAGARYCLPG